MNGCGRWVPLLKRWLCHAEVTIDLECLDPILVKSGQPTIDGPDMVPVVSMRSGEREYFIPGSSLKGAFRSHTEKLIRTLKPNSVCAPYIRRSQDADSLNDLHQSCSTALRPKQKAEAYRLSCPTCRTFGSLSFGGRLSPSDALPVGPKPIVEERDGVAIDRFTGGAARGAKFNMLVITAGTFRTTLTLRNFEFWQLGIVHILIEDLSQGLIRIGSGKSRGLGRVKGNLVNYKVSYVKPQEELCGIGELCTLEERRSYGFHLAEYRTPSLGEPQVRGLQHVYNITDRYHEFSPVLAKAFIDFVEQGYKPDWLTQIKRGVR